jgi:uncharacterized membrane protein
MSPASAAGPQATPDPGERRLVAVALAVAAGLRLWEGSAASLWLDELHTLSHASLPSAAEVVEQVARERVHVPLYFLGVHAFGGWEQGASLRLLSIAAGLLLFLPALSLARRAAAAPLGAWLIACTPYQVHYATELRPYAWFALLGAGAAWAAFAERGPRWGRFALFFGCVLAGIWTHYLMAVAVLSIGFARLFVRRREMLPLGWLIGAGALAVVPSLPPMLAFLERATELRFEHQASVGGYELRDALKRELLALPTRLLVPYLGALGGGWAQLARAGAVLLFGGIAAAALAAWRARRAGTAPPWTPPLRALAIFAAAYFVLTTGLSWYAWDRVPLQYFVPMAWALPVLVAALAGAVGGRARRPISLLLALGALALGVAQAGGHGTEDVRAAVAAARAQGATLERPIYSALLSQPTLFEHTLPYKAYGRDLGALEPPAVPAPGAEGSERPLVVIVRRVPYDDPGWRPLLAGRRVAREVAVGERLSVVVLVPD